MDLVLKATSKTTYTERGLQSWNGNCWSSGCSTLMRPLKPLNPNEREISKVPESRLCPKVGIYRSGSTRPPGVDQMDQNYP